MLLCPGDRFLEKVASVEFSGWCFGGEFGLGATDQNENDRVGFDNRGMFSELVLVV